MAGILFASLAGQTYGLSQTYSAKSTLSDYLGGEVVRWMQILSTKRELSFHIIDVFLMLVLSVIFLTLIVYLILYDRPKPGLAGVESAIHL